MKERIIKSESFSNEILSPAQSVVTEIVTYVHKGIDVYNVSGLALFLRHRGLTAETIKPIISIGRQMFKQEPYPGLQAILELCADNYDPIGDISSLSEHQKYELVKYFTNTALPYLTSQTLAVLRQREEEFGLDLFPEDIIGKEFAEVYQGQREVKQIDTSVWGLGEDLFVWSGKNFNGPKDDPDDSDYIKVIALIEKAKSLQLD